MLKKKLGLRYRMNPCLWIPSLVKGSHGRIAAKPEEGAVIGPLTLPKTPGPRQTWPPSFVIISNRHSATIHVVLDLAPTPNNRKHPMITIIRFALVLMTLVVVSSCTTDEAESPDASDRHNRHP